MDDPDAPPPPKGGREFILSSVGIQAGGWIDVGDSFVTIFVTNKGPRSRTQFSLLQAPPQYARLNGVYFHCVHRCFSIYPSGRRYTRDRNREFISTVEIDGGCVVLCVLRRLKWVVVLWSRDATLSAIIIVIIMPSSPCGMIDSSVLWFVPPSLRGHLRRLGASPPPYPLKIHAPVTNDQ